MRLNIPESQKKVKKSDNNDWGQIIDGLTCRAEQYEHTRTTPRNRNTLTTSSSMSTMQKKHTILPNGIEKLLKR